MELGYELTARPESLCQLVELQASELGANAVAEAPKEAWSSGPRTEVAELSQVFWSAFFGSGAGCAEPPVACEGLAPGSPLCPSHHALQEADDLEFYPDKKL